MSGAERTKPKPRATKARVKTDRAEALRLRAGGLTVVAIGKALGLSPQRAGRLLKPVSPNHCRACGGQIEPQKQYHPQCRPSNRTPSGRPGGARPIELPERRYGLWTVLAYAGAAKWRCRCRCGVERPVTTWSLKGGRSRGCQSCSARERWARVREGKRRGKKPSG